MFALAAGSAVRAQIAPNPNSVSNFAPVTFNGSEAGYDGWFMVGTMPRLGQFVDVTLWALDGRDGTLIVNPSTLPTPPSVWQVPYTVSPQDTAILPEQSPLAGIMLHNGLAPAGVDPGEDDNPQGFNFAGPPPGGRTMHQRRHRLSPVNQELVQWLVTGQDPTERLMISTVAKPDVNAAQMEGGVLSVDYRGYPTATLPAFISSVWPSATGAAAPGNGAGVNSTTYYAGGPAGPWLPQVLSDLAPNVFANTTASSGGPNGLAWVAGSQTFGDFSDPVFGPVPGRLVVADYSAPGAVPQVVGADLQSPFSPYADKILVWTRIEPLPGLLPQYLLVPCRDGVEIYDPAPPGPPPVAPVLVKVIPVPAGKEICSNVSYFGPSSLDGPAAANPYFIVLMRDRRIAAMQTDPGETQGANGGINFLVFDLLPSSQPASFPTPAPGAGDPSSGLGAFLPVATPLDMVRSFNDIAIAPPERNEVGGWKSDPRPNATAWFGVWAANASLAGQTVFGAMVGVENHGLNTYWDGQAGFNAAFSGSYPNVRYFTPVDAQGDVFEPFPVPVCEVSTNPIFNGSPAGDLVNQNLVAWYFDNGQDYGVAVLDVLATWRPLSNQAVPGGILVDGTAGGTYSASPARSHETITERPLFGYMNYPVFATVFAQRQCGIETFAGWMMPSLPPLNRPRYHLSRFGVPGVQSPQTPPPQNITWNYQKRAHSVFQPAFIDHVAVGSSPYTQFNDICIAIQSTEPLAAPVPQAWPGEDDPVAYFVNWRWDPVIQISPWPQGVNYLDWHSALATNPQNNRLWPWFGRDPTVPSHFATTSPPPNSTQQGIPMFGGAHYFPLQTPLWVDWSGPGIAGAGGAFMINLTDRSVLRSHANPYPLNGNDAWVGLGADMRLKFSFAFNLQQDTNPNLGVVPARSIIAAHIQQTQFGTASPGLPPSAGGPGGYRFVFLHYQADPTPSQPLTPNGPGWEMTCVNGVPQGGAPSWQFEFPFKPVVCTEVLALQIR